MHNIKYNSMRPLHGITGRLCRHVIIFWFKVNACEISCHSAITWPIPVKLGHRKISWMHIYYNGETIKSEYRQLMPSVDDADTELETAKWVTQWTLSSPGKFGKFLAKHSLRPEGLVSIYEKTDWTCSHEYSHRFGNRQRRSTKTIWCNWQKGNAFWL